jgi:ComF family protein
VQLARDVGGDCCATCGEDRGAHLLIEGRCTDCRLCADKARYEGFVRVGRYGPTLSRLVLRFKRDFTLDFLLGNMLAAAIGARPEFESVDCWVPIPTHWRTRLIRGYQPTALLAQAIARHTGRGRFVQALSMTRLVRPFHFRQHMSATARAEEIRDAFRVIRPSLIEGQAVCLVDDVSTTGATLLEARRMLRRAGAKAVFAAVVAKTSRVGAGVDPANAQS